MSEILERLRDFKKCVLVSSASCTANRRSVKLRGRDHRLSLMLLYQETD